MAGADVVDDAVQGEAALGDGLLDRGVLLEDVEGGVDVELGHVDGARVVVGQLVQLGSVFSAQPVTGVCVSKGR